MNRVCCPGNTYRNCQKNWKPNPCALLNPPNVVNFLITQSKKNITSQGNLLICYNTRAGGRFKGASSNKLYHHTRDLFSKYLNIKHQSGRSWAFFGSLYIGNSIRGRVSRKGRGAQLFHAEKKRGKSCQ